MNGRGAAPAIDRGERQASGSLRRTLGFMDLVLITIGTVIGSGIYLVPGVVLRQTGGQTSTALLVWTVGGVLSLLGALTYAELGAMNPEAGGLYVYIRDAFGSLPSFLYGWTSFFVISSGSLATLAVAFSGYLGQFVPIGRGGARAVSVLLIGLLAVVNIRGTRTSATMQNWTTGLKIGALTLLGGSLIVFGHGASSQTATLSGAIAPATAAGFGAAMIGVLWAYEGWQYVSFSAGETRDPQRTFPRAITIGTLALVAIYLLANVGYVVALGPAAVAGSEHVAADAAGAILGPVAGRLVGVLILVSIFSASNGLVLTTPRMYFAMARDRVFFERLARVHPRFGTPAFAILAIALWAALLAATGTFEQLLTYVIFAGWIFYALGALSVFVYRRRQPNTPRAFRVPGYPVTPLLFVLSAVLLVLNTVLTQPGRAAVGLGAVLLGTPAFYLWRAHARRRVVPPVQEPHDAPAT
ncbi:MAG TPA: amino acid permease [Gemmatimonadaceae bacterium]|nr:amino acid permease [Gemmatimonadaceae bacterium]